MNIAACLSIYAATIAFIFLNPEFMKHMLVHSVFQGSEVGNASDRPVYMALNFIHTFFSFVYKGNISHFMAGAAADWFTAIGVIAGLLWTAVVFKKDWRARWLLLSYVTLVFFIGAIAQYKYPPNTRVNFLAPMFSILAGVGLSRLSAAAVFFKKDAFRKYRAIITGVLVLIALNNIYRFYVYMPRVFIFTPEAYMVKYMQEKADKNMKYVMVTNRMQGSDKVPVLYGFKKNFSSIPVQEFERKLRDVRLAPAVYMFTYDTTKSRPLLSDSAEPGQVLINYDGYPAITAFDLNDPESRVAFRGLWVSGKPAPAALAAARARAAPVKTARPARMKKAKADKIGLESGRKKVFRPEANYRPRRLSEIKGYKISGLKLGAELKAPTDIAVSRDGKTLFITDSGLRKVLKFNASTDGSYTLAAQFAPGKKGMFDFLRPAVTNGAAGYLYAAINHEFRLLYVLDSYKGKISEFDLDGNLKKELISGKFLRQASSLAVSNGGLLIAAANPEENMFVVLNIDGEIISAYSTTHGLGMGQLNMPSRAVFDGENNIYVVDAINYRVDLFGADGRYRTNFRIGLLSRYQRPGITVVEERPGKPFFAVTQPETKRIYFFLLKEDAFRFISLGGTGDYKPVNPSGLVADWPGNFYMLDPGAKSVFKISIPKNAMDVNIPFPERR